MIYLASPYSWPIEERGRRHRQNTFAMGFLLTQGFQVFSPICHTHHVSQYLQSQKCDLEPEDWYALCDPFMAVCDRIVVLQLTGWRESKGVEREISYFWNKRGIKAEFMNPAGFQIHELPWPRIGD